jgi:hypothetical protein
MTEDIENQVKGFLTELQSFCEENGFFPEYEKVCKEMLSIPMVKRLGHESGKVPRLEMPTSEVLNYIAEAMFYYSLAEAASTDLRRLDAAESLSDAGEELARFLQEVATLRRRREEAMRLPLVERPLESLNTFVLFVLGENHDQNDRKSFRTFEEVMNFVHASYGNMLASNNETYFPEATKWGDSHRWGERIKAGLKKEPQFRNKFELFTGVKLET